MNKVILMGRLTRDPMINYSQGERSICVARFTLAVDRRFAKKDANGGQQQQTADFISCVAFDKQGEFVEKYLHQGTKIVISGRIQTGSYTNKEGQRVYTTDVITEEIDFAESKNASAGGGVAAAYNPGGGFNNGGGYVNNGRPNPAAAAVSNDGFMSIPDGVEEEGLPFN